MPATGPSHPRPPAEVVYQSMTIVAVLLLLASLWVF